MAAPVCGLRWQVGYFPNGRRWLARSFRPGSAPVTDIKRALIIYLLSDFVALIKKPFATRHLRISRLILIVRLSTTR
jgi:hypothetical protein